MNFSNYAEALEWMAAKEKEYGGKMKFRSSKEYHEAYPKMTELYKSEGHKRPKKRRVEIRFCISA